MYNDFTQFVKAQFPGQDFIPLHEPRFIGNERKYVLDAIDSTFVSSVGEYVNRFEEMMCEITGAEYAVATVNGTAALHIAIKLAGVNRGDEVLLQPLTFVATANALAYEGAIPHYIDVSSNTLGLSASALEERLSEIAELREDGCYNKETGKRISACIPMHTFGFPCEIDEIASICSRYKIVLIEDAAESLGSTYKNKHTGTFGLMGTYSFNGNKTVTCGGGGAIVTDDEHIAKLAKHITTTAKVPHAYEYVHDRIGYNYRMPNLNAAMACAQLEKLNDFIQNKRELSTLYHSFFQTQDFATYLNEPADSFANYWLNVIQLNDESAKHEFLEFTNANGVMTRPVWRMMNKLSMYAHGPAGNLDVAEQLESTLVNIPSSVRV